MNSISNFEPSEYQRDCADYYGLLRDVHSGVYASDRRRVEEWRDDRYVAEDPPELLQADPFNLATLIEILHQRCGDGAEVKGIDFGCGSHWFVDHVRAQFGWSAIGYDPDAKSIEDARELYDSGDDCYRVCDLLREGLPVEDGSQTFVFCNAVLQHFDDAECEQAVREMARVLKPDGCCLLIFKRWTAALADGTDPLSPSIRILDATGGKVLFEDPTMKARIAKLDSSRLCRLGEEQRRGWRLLHLVSVELILEMARALGLQPAYNVSIGASGLVRGVLRYRGGKQVPTAAVFLVKSVPR